MMTNLLNGAQVANSIKNLLQGYTKGIRFVAVLTMLLIVGVGQAWGTEVTFDATKDKGSTSTGAVSFEKDGITLSVENGALGNGTDYRVYKNTKLTISSSVGTITNIAFTFSSASNDGGGWSSSYQPNAETWTSPTANGEQARIKNIIVTYTPSSGETPGEGGGEDPETPGESDDATMTAGTNGSACTVNGKEGIKVGTSSKGGDMQITVPAGATMLHVYAAAWNGVTGLSLNITPTSNVTTTSIALTADAGIANSTPFTLSGNEADYLFDIPLQNITAETTLTFTSSTAKRFVVWGATYEISGSGTTEPSYSVTYEADGGETTCEDNTKYEEGDDVMLCGEIPTKENYVFNGWSSDPSVTVTDGKFKMPKSNVIFTAQWSECTGPRITAFNKSGKTDGTYNLGAELGTLSVTAEPSNGGNLRYCWYQYDDATTINQAIPAAGTNNEATYQIPNNEPCTARHYYCIVSEEGCDKTKKTDNSGALYLNAIQHTITWSVNGTTQSLSPSSVTDGNNLGTLPTPNLDGICEGKTFVGWTTEAYNNYFNETTPPLFIEATTQPEGNTTYYAVFATPEEGGTKTIIFADEWNNTQDLSEHSYFDNAITLSFAKNEGTTAPRYYETGEAIRLYYDNTMTVTTTTIMQSITFTFVTEDAKGNSISTNPDFGTLSKTPTDQSSESLTHTWNVNTTSVTFTIGKDQNSNASGHCKISQIDVVTGDGDAASYSDYTTSCVPTYTITWKNEDGTVLETDKVAENTTPTYDGSTPTKAATEQYTYTFNGWDPEIVAATEDAIYTATYTETLRNYTITWKNGETTLETDNNVPYGETPSYDGATPTKTATAQYTYTFHGWSPEVTSVTGDATYIATFTETLRTYTITWKNDDGTTLETDENVPYGTTPSYDGEEPTKTATAQHSYDFNGWSPEVTSVTGDATYTAKYTAIVNIIWMVNGIQKNSTTASSGASVTPPDVNPIPCGAVLAGWTDAENGVYVHDTSTLYAGEKPSIKVTENKTFYAVFADYDEQQ